jgi:diaminopimelate decarboxylase
MAQSPPVSDLLAASGVDAAKLPPQPGAPGWPSALEISADERLLFDGCDLVELADQRGTPLWVISRSMIEGNFDRFLGAMRARYPHSEVAYSIKAHNTMAVIKLLHMRGAKMDCSAEHEVQLALLAGVPPDDVILNGSGKSDQALYNAAKLGVREVNVDSLEEAHRLNAVAAELGRRVNCTVRVQLTYHTLLGKDPTYEPSLRLIDKAGSSLGSGRAMEVVAAILESSHLDFVGLHHHKVFSGYSGSSFDSDNELMHHRECTRELCEFANEIKRVHGVEVQRFNLGGGFRADGWMLRVTPGGADDAYHQYAHAADYAEAIFGTIEAVLDATEPPLVQFETGGQQISDAVILLSTVSEVKDVPPIGSAGDRRFVFIDASMMMFVIRGMQGSVPGHPMISVDRPLAPAEEDVAIEVAGQTCMYDTIAFDIRLPAVQPGDRVALLNQGAYVETMSTQMNGFPRPEVVLVHRGAAVAVKRRETFSDIYARHLLPAELWNP